MRARTVSLPSSFSTRNNAFKLALVGGVLAIAALASAQRANADSALCANGTTCGHDLPSHSSDQHFFRFSTAHDQVSSHDTSLRRSELSVKDYPSYSGV